MSSLLKSVDTCSGFQSSGLGKSRGKGLGKSVNGSGHPLIFLHKRSLITKAPQVLGRLST